MPVRAISTAILLSLSSQERMSKSTNLTPSLLCIVLFGCCDIKAWRVVCVVWCCVCLEVILCDVALFNPSI